MHWHTECVTRLEARCEELKFQNRQQTDSSGHNEKAPVGGGGGGRARDSGTAPNSFAGTPPRGGRTSARAEETTATWLEEIPSRRDQGTGFGTEHVHLWTRRQAPGQGGVDPRPVALVRETDRNRNGAARSMIGGRADHHDDPISPEQGVFPETPTGDGRRCLHDSDGSKAVDHSFGGFGILKGENDSPNPFSNVGTGRRMASARGQNKQPRSERQASSRTAHGIRTKATMGKLGPPIFGNDGFAIGNTLGVRGRLRVESDNLGIWLNFSPRTLRFLRQFCRLEDGPLSLGDSLKTLQQPRSNGLKMSEAGSLA